MACWRGRSGVVSGGSVARYEGGIFVGRAVENFSLKNYDNHKDFDNIRAASLLYCISRVY